MVMAPYAPILTTVPRSLATMAGRVLMVSIHLPAIVPRATPEPIDENACDSADDCNNHGTCVAQSDGNICECEEAYSGINCEIFDDPCLDPNPCLNGGTCTTTGNTTYICICADGFEGSNCEETDVECENSTECNDNNFCNGTETCVNGNCITSAPPNCSGTTPYCNETTDQCECSGNSCDDGAFCNGTETCNNGTCAAGTTPNCTGSTPTCNERHRPM